MTTRADTSELTRLAASWRRSLRAANKADNTIKLYLDAVRLLDAHLAAVGHSRAVADIHRRDIEDFINHLLDTVSASTAATRFRGLQQMFKWLVEEEEIDRSPISGMKPPALEERPVDVIPPEHLQRLLKVCEGRGFLQRRDKAILSVFIDSGARAAEVAGLQFEDLDMDLEVVHIVGKGRRHRSAPLGPKAIRDVDRYIRERERHPQRHLPDLWLAQKGAMTPSGIAQMMKRRCAQAGVAPVHPHQFRHTFSHLYLAAGGNERDLMNLAGWKSPQMLQRYGASLATERAHQAHRRLSPRERL